MTGLDYCNSLYHVRLPIAIKTGVSLVIDGPVYAIIRMRPTTAASRIKKVGGAGSCNLPTAEIMARKNFNFPVKFSKDGGFRPANVALLDDNFPTKRKFSTKLSNNPKCRGRGRRQLPPPPLHATTSLSATHLTELGLQYCNHH